MRSVPFLRGGPTPLFFLVLTALAAVLPAQGPASAEPVAARLLPELDTAVAGQSLGLTLRVEVRDDTKLDAAVLGGQQLVLSFEGKSDVHVGKAANRKVDVAAGTKIERTLQIDVPAAAGGHRLTMSWPGLDGAAATIKVVPDPASYTVDELDLSRTKVLLHTDLGDMTLTMMPDKAPKTVRSFVELSRKGFYDQVAFHRVIPGFMIQGGDPNTKPGATGMPGTGGPGYTLPDEFNDTRHVRGVVSMANTGQPDSAGSQFFIVLADRSGPRGGLDGKYTAFARLESGQDTLDRIAQVPLQRAPNSGDPVPSQPVEPVRIEKAVVLPAMADKPGKEKQ